MSHLDWNRLPEPVHEAPLSSKLSPISEGGALTITLDLHRLQHAYQNEKPRSAATERGETRPTRAETDTVRLM